LEKKYGRWPDEQSSLCHVFPRPSQPIVERVVVHSQSMSRRRMTPQMSPLFNVNYISRRDKAPKRRSARTNCRISTSTTSAGSVSARARSHSCITARGGTRREAIGPTYCPSRSAINTTWPRSRSGWRSSSTVSSKRASSSAPACPTGRRSVQVAHYRHEEIGTRRAIPRPSSGRMSCGATCRVSPDFSERALHESRMGGG
jgi:hypothetical protein